MKQLGVTNPLRIYRLDKVFLDGILAYNFLELHGSNVTKIEEINTVWCGRKMCNQLLGLFLAILVLGIEAIV